MSRFWTPKIEFELFRFVGLTTFPVESIFYTSDTSCYTVLFHLRFSVASAAKDKPVPQVIVEQAQYELLSSYARLTGTTVDKCVREAIDDWLQSVASERILQLAAV